MVLRSNAAITYWNNEAGLDRSRFFDTHGHYMQGITRIDLQWLLGDWAISDGQCLG